MTPTHTNSNGVKRPVTHISATDSATEPQLPSNIVEATSTLATALLTQTTAPVPVQTPNHEHSPANLFANLAIQTKPLNLQEPNEGDVSQKRLRFAEDTKVATFDFDTSEIERSDGTLRPVKPCPKAITKGRVSLTENAIRTLLNKKNQSAQKQEEEKRFTTGIVGNVTKHMLKELLNTNGLTVEEFNKLPRQDKLRFQMAAIDKCNEYLRDELNAREPDETRLPTPEQLSINTRSNKNLGTTKLFPYKE